MLLKFWHRLIEIPASDPDEARRRRLLSIILLGLFGAGLVLLLLLLGLSWANPQPADQDDLRVWGSAVVALFGFAALYLLGRSRSGYLASLLFLVFMIVILLFSDTPQEVVGGRSTYYAVLPIIMASILFRPSTSFHVAGSIIVLHALIAWRLGLTLDMFAPLLFGLTALLSWLSAHTLEQALQEARRLNRELDQRVHERTQDLQAALLREQAEAGQNRAILHSIGDSVMVFDRAGHLIVANPALSRLTGRPMDVMLGKPFEVFLQDLSPEHQAAARALLHAPGENRSVQLALGRQVLSLHMAPVQLESGQPVGVVAVLHDITQEVEVSRMKSAFVAMVSHELRTPLNAILGLVELLQHQIYGPLNDKQADVVRRVMANVDRLSVLVKDLLDHARIEAGTLTILPQPFSPAELLQTQLDPLVEPARGRGLSFMTEIDPALPPQLVGDPQRLGQILINLAANALKFTEHGQVRVCCSRFSAERWALSVSDSGPGIPPEAQARIFEPFWQADSTIGRKHGGAGLGLSIVRRLADLMDGEIHLESQVGAGSTFTVTFPFGEGRDTSDDATHGSRSNGK